MRDEDTITHRQTRLGNIKNNCLPGHGIRAYTCRMLSLHRIFVECTLNPLTLARQTTLQVRYQHEAHLCALSPYRAALRDAQCFNAFLFGKSSRGYFNSHFAISSGSIENKFAVMRLLVLKWLARTHCFVWWRGRKPFWNIKMPFCELLKKLRAKAWSCR